MTTRKDVRETKVSATPKDVEDLSKTEWQQLKFYAERAFRQGDYYGKKSDFDKRHVNISNFLRLKIKEN